MGPSHVAVDNPNLSGSLHDNEKALDMLIEAIGRAGSSRAAIRRVIVGDKRLQSRV